MGCFEDTLDLYFQLCSIETNTDTLAVMAATLANGGVSPLHEERVVCNRAVRDTLSLMYSCGMYDYSGQFAFTVRPYIETVFGVICSYNSRTDNLPLPPKWYLYNICAAVVLLSER